MIIPRRSLPSVAFFPAIALAGAFVYQGLQAQPEQAQPIATAKSAQSVENSTLSNQKLVRNTSNLIDQAVMKDLSKKTITPNAIVDDATFLRRAYLQIIGRIPTHGEATRFLTDKSADKRAQLIDSLIYSDGFNSHLFNYWADMLRLKTNQDQHGLGWHVWIREAVNNNMPYDQFVNKMLAANGHVSTNPAVAYYLRDRNMLLDNISNTVQVFLGTQIGCAQCHDHPFEDWTQKSYYSLAAFAGSIDYKPKSAQKKVLETVKYLAKKEGIIKPGDELDLAQLKKNKGKNNKNTKKNRKARKQQQAKINKLRSYYRKVGRDLRSLFKDFNKNEVALNATKTLKLPHDYQYNDGKPGEVVQPAVLFGEMPKLKPGENRLEAFANWVTSPENPQFTKTIANRLWKRVYGYALAEPVDDWTDSTRVSHPEALAMVEKLLRMNHYNVRETLRVLYHTKLFQREVAHVEIEGGKAYQFQGPVLQRLSAEQIHDSLITLERGNIDKKKNHQFKHKWTHFTKSIDKLMNASPELILQIDDLADKTESQLDSLKKQARSLRLALKKAEGENNTAKAKEIKLKQRTLYSKIKAIQRKAKQQAMTSNNPEMVQMAQMAQMGRLRVKSKGILRASEKPSPAKDGNLMHQFGASDRRTPDAASTHASIPQTLTLLNGREVMSVTDHKGAKGSLPALMRAAKTNTEKLDILFIAIYGCYPTDAERSKYSKHMENRKSTQVFAKAMLNSKRFLFIQ